jgi:superfamily II DNA helicase RecQ
MFLHLESRGAVIAIAKQPASPLLQPVKRPKLEVSRVIQGLQKVLGPDARPWSQGQAEVLELVYTTTATRPQIIILGTGSNKSLLFFLVAAIVSPQTVIVVVPFAALVDDLVSRARVY